MMIGLFFSIFNSFLQEQCLDLDEHNQVYLGGWYMSK